MLGALEADFNKAALSKADLAMLMYADKLTCTPNQMKQADVDALRAVGFNDHGVHDICTVAAYFGFVNRIADGLGVELEPRFGSEENATQKNVNR